MRDGSRRAAALVMCLAALATGCTAGGGATGGPATPDASAGSVPPEAGFTSRVLATGLDNPWEITWGPDGYLWVTEKSAGRVTRVAAADGAKKTAVTIDEVLATKGAQDGLLGMALHPRLSAQPQAPFVYVAYTYDTERSPDRVNRRAKIVRYTYDRDTQTLGRAADVLTGLPASGDHNAGRLIFGPDEKLYYSIGDQGRNQFDAACEPIQAQRLPTAGELAARDWKAYQGKILRLNVDGSVPADNPVLRGVRSHVYSFGHRNAQGLAFGPDGRLYSSEQGPKSDDEVNRIRAGGNYGWPRVNGFPDDQAYVYGNWSASRGTDCPSLSYSDFEIPASVPQEKESGFKDPAAVPPVRTFFTVASTYNFQDPRCEDAYFICWPTVAPASLDVYRSGCAAAPGDSLLMPSLKDGVVYRMPLSADGATVGEPSALWRTVNRYRDTAVNPDGTAVYVATDKSGLTRDGSGRPTSELADPGAIVEFRCPD